MSKKIIAIFLFVFLAGYSYANAAYYCKEHNIWHDGSRSYFCKTHNTWHRNGTRFYCKEHNTWHSDFGCCHSLNYEISNKNDIYLALLCHMSDEV